MQCAMLLSIVIVIKIYTNNPDRVSDSARLCTNLKNVFTLPHPKCDYLMLGTNITDFRDKNH